MMKTTSIRSLWIVGLVLLMAAAGQLRAAPGDVKTSFEAPCKYPSGLATDGRHFYVADWREAVIHQVRCEDGSEVRSIPAPTLMPHGLTWADGLLYVSDDHTGWVYALNPVNGIVENSFEAPESSATGLAWADGTLFILARGRIYRVLPEDGTILNSFAAPERTCRCLAWDGRYLWASDRIKDELYMIEPADGKVIGILASPAPYPAGIAWLDGHLWNVDFQRRTIYQLTIADDQPYRLSDTRRARVEYFWALNNYGPGEIRDLTVNIALPVELPNQKLLSEIGYSTPPAALASDRWQQPCALFRVGTVAAAAKAIVSYSVEAEVSAIRYLIIPDDSETLGDIPKEIRDQYTVDGSRYRISSPYIEQTAKKIVGDETNPYRIARKIYDFVIDHLEYEMVGGWDVPEVVLKRGSGSCSEYTFSFVALCRAAGLPARYQGSIVVRGDDASIDEAFHRWAQIYLPRYGWVPVDANAGDKPSPADQCRGFGGLSNRFLITTQSGGDSEYLRWGYNSFSSYQSTGYCKIEEDNFGFWEPLEDEEEVKEPRETP
jgi:transglutaminase-like putative cysteine protease